MLPHLNPGVMSWEEPQRLKPVAPSMGMMLETIPTTVFSAPGGCHYGSPDKDPAVRLRVLEDASRTGPRGLQTELKRASRDASRSLTAAG